MPNREKVIKGLQCIIDGTVRCASCGYAIDKYGHYGCQQECAKDALALLKEQEPVIPKTKVRHGEYPEIVYRCGKCKAVIDRRDKYCRDCGRAVQWE